MTVFARFKSPDPSEQMAPALALLYEKINERSGALRYEPLAVDEALFKAGEAEMVALRKERGFNEIARAHIPDTNFLLFGIPIISNG